MGYRRCCGSVEAGSPDERVAAFGIERETLRIVALVEQNCLLLKKVSVYNVMGYYRDSNEVHKPCVFSTGFVSTATAAWFFGVWLSAAASAPTT